MGRPTRSEIRNQFDTFNADFFGGKLPRVRLQMRNMNNCEGVQLEPSKRYPNGLIVLGWPCRSPSGWRGVLLHEMIHIHLDIKGVDEVEWGEEPYHGPRFAAECNRIGRLLGIPEYHDEECYQWPDEHLMEGLPED